MNDDNSRRNIPLIFYEYVCFNSLMWATECDGILHEHERVKKGSEIFASLNLMF